MTTARAVQFGPNWFTSVMGTGIVAVSLANLPFDAHYLRPIATAVWALAAVVLACLIALCVRQRDGVRAYEHDPVLAQSWGAPPMALLTVGTGALLLGRDWIGLPSAVAVDWVLWTAGTLLGLVTSVWIPYRMMTSHDIGEASTFAGWLMPVVPPMVSAATGPLLLPHLPDGQAKVAMLAACAAMFGLSLMATLVLFPQIWRHLVRHKADASTVPTVWIALGPLGQSVTAAAQIGGALPGPYAAVSLLYGVPMWGFAMLWLAIAAALTLRHRRAMPFALTWWSFTFPLGTVVTGTSALATRTGVHLFAVIAVALFVLLVALWSMVATRTARMLIHASAPEKRLP